MKECVKLEPSVRGEYPEFVAGYAIIKGVVVKKRVEELEEEKRKLLKEVKKKYEGMSVTSIPEVILYRNFFKKMGVDPSKQRPPAEYLLRRALVDRFPSVNNVVDCCLLITLRDWITISAFDLDKIKGELRIELGKKFEEFKLIDGRIVSPAIRDIIIRDEEKILSAYSVGDAEAAMITPETKNVLLVAWNAPGIDREKTEIALRSVADFMNKFCGGEQVKLSML